MTTVETLKNIRRKYPARITRGDAIKLYCKEICCGGQENCWRDCPMTSCFLWPFRKGREEAAPKKGKINKYSRLKCQA